MKKVMVVLLVVMLSALLLAVTGCGEGEQVEEGEAEVVEMVPEPASEGIHGEYKQSDGEATISLYDDGTFTTDSGEEGSFVVKGDSLEFNYQGEEPRTEIWTIMVTEGEPPAIVDPDGVEYKRVEE